jgi:2-polyprenyl-3-methyl-5-hydroxy-6-metoxy-1,4-benzoquinol methylase
MTTTTETNPTPITDVPDQERMEQFGQQLAQCFVSTGVTLMVDLGNKTGLFEAAARGPATSTELAQRAGLSERHVREWLGSMTCAGIVEHDPDTDRFTLPPEHAALLTGDTPLNQATISPLLVHLAGFVDPVAEAFRHGGGVDYHHYRPGFTGTMDEIGRRRYDALLIDEYLPLVDGVRERLEAGTRVADIGCGTGHCLNLMARRYPDSTFVGYDLADDAIDRARDEARGWGLTNVSFEVLDVNELPTDPGFGIITAFDAIHDQVDPSGVLDRTFRALEPGGVFFMIDIRASSNLDRNIANPLAPLIYAISVLHCMEVSLAGDGAGLGTAWGEELASSMLQDAGFTDIEVHDLEDDPFNLVYGARRPG